MQPQALILLAQMLAQRQTGIEHQLRPHGRRHRDGGRSREQRARLLTYVGKRLICCAKPSVDSAQRIGIRFWDGFGIVDGHESGHAC